METSIIGYVFHVREGDFFEEIKNGFKNFKIERKTIGLTPIRLNQEDISKINKYKNPIKSLKRLYKY